MRTNFLKRFSLAICLVLALFTITLISANTACQPPNDNVTYEVIGNADSVNVVLNNDMGGSETYNDVPLPFRMDYGGFNERYVYLYAYNTGETGTITVNIYVNGKLFKTATGSGPYTTAIVEGNK
jgi:hypothetical protein